MTIANQPTRRSASDRVRWTPLSIGGGIAIAAIGLVFAYKLINADLKLIDLSTTDFLSLILAVFAIWMSMMFYWKADESSRQFYDDTYKFTMEFSTMLGRIEAGFGNHLEHLTNSYDKLDDNMRRMARTEQEAETEVVTQAQQVQTAQEDTRKLFDDLAEKAKLPEPEKALLEEKLAETQAQLMDSSKELERARSMLAVTQNEHAALMGRLKAAEREESHIRRFDLVRTEESFRTFFDKSPTVKDAVERSLGRGVFPLGVLPDELINQLRRKGLLDERNQLNTMGQAVIKASLAPF